jgi:hypothetical protein
MAWKYLTLRELSRKITYSVLTGIFCCTHKVRTRHGESFFGAQARPANYSTHGAKPCQHLPPAHSFTKHARSHCQRRQANRCADLSTDGLCARQSHPEGLAAREYSFALQVAPGCSRRGHEVDLTALSGVVYCPRITPGSPLPGMSFGSCFAICVLPIPSTGRL